MAENLLFHAQISKLYNMSINLIIGDTSQQSYYYPESFLKLSSRNIDIDYLSKLKFDTVVLPFAEQRIYDKNIDFIGINYHLTFQIIKSLIENSNRIIIFSSCELWANHSGIVNLETKYSFDESNEYAVSKRLLVDKIKSMRIIDDRYNKVIIIHPFYFNSIHRSSYFLFGKIFNSIINKEKIKVGNLNFRRDMVYTSFFVKNVLDSYSDTIIGAGKLFNARDYITDLYSSFNMKFEDYVLEEYDKNIPVREKLITADVKWNYDYKNLLDDTVMDIKRKIDV